MICYQIKDWNNHFENDRSRNRKHCSFVCVPNKQHGMGFSRIMAEPDGASIYGIWHCILGACSQQSVRDGWLTDDGDREGSAWGVDDLSLKFRRPAEEIGRALDFLCSDKVKWIIKHEINDLPSSHRAVTAQSPSGILKEGREEKEEKEEKYSGKRTVDSGDKHCLGDASSIYSTESRVALHYLNEKSGKHFRECESSLAPINARMKESGVDIGGVKKMIDRQCGRWLGTPQEEYLRPQTLFGKEKFDGYYASKELPIQNENTTRPPSVNGNVAAIQNQTALTRVEERIKVLRGQAPFAAGDKRINELVELKTERTRLMGILNFKA